MTSLLSEPLHQQVGKRIRCKGYRGCSDFFSRSMEVRLFFANVVECIDVLLRRSMTVSALRRRGRWGHRRFVLVVDRGMGFAASRSNEVWAFRRGSRWGGGLCASAVDAAWTYAVRRSMPLGPLHHQAHITVSPCIPTFSLANARNGLRRSEERLHLPPHLCHPPRDLARLAQ